MSRKQIPVRIDLPLADALAREAKFRKMAQNSLIEAAIKNYLDGGEDLRERNYDPNAVDPLLLRMFSDDRGFDILEWVTDEPGRGEQAVQVGARVRSGTLRIIDAIVAHPNCPFATRSDFIRHALLVGAYVAARGSLLDDRIAEFARKERKLAQILWEQERFRVVDGLLNESRSNVESEIQKPEGYVAGAARQSYEQVARLLREGIPQNLTEKAIGVAKWVRTHLGEDCIEGMDLRYPEVKEMLE